MSILSNEQMAALAAPFPIDAHTVREGFRNNGKTKIRWFVYVDVREVVGRLNSVLGSGWSTTKPEIVPLSTGIIASIGITISGETRWYTGGQDFDVDYKTGAVNPSSDDGKGAVTDAIRRAASLWGVAEYIYSMELEIWTDAYEKNDWDKQKALKAEALKRFTDWYNRQFKAQKPAPSVVNPTPSTTTPQPPKSPFGSQPDATPTWLNTEVGKCWGVLKAYLISEKLYSNEFEMRASFAKRGVTVDGNFTDEWKVKPARELVDFVKSRHQQEQNDIDFMGEPA